MIISRSSSTVLCQAETASRARLKSAIVNASYTCFVWGVPGTSLLIFGASCGLFDWQFSCFSTQSIMPQGHITWRQVRVGVSGVGLDCFSQHTLIHTTLSRIMLPASDETLCDCRWRFDEMPAMLQRLHAWLFIFTSPITSITCSGPTTCFHMTADRLTADVKTLHFAQFLVQAKNCMKRNSTSVCSISLSR